MPKIKFREIRLSADNQARLNKINSIIGEYQKQGLRLTLRQLYYQLVSRDIIPNKKQEYSNLSKLLKEGRMAGIVDWSAIEDRLRTAEKPASWDTPRDAMNSLINQYERPRMDGQENYLEVWVEKDALSGVLSVVTEEYHIPILVNRGYSSVSAIYDSYKRFKLALEKGQKVIILYLGDYDPSGIDMIRDVKDRPLEMLLAKHSFIDEVYEEWVNGGDRENEEYREYDMGDKYGDDEDCYEIDHWGDGKKDYDKNFCPQKAFIKDRFQVIPIALTTEQIKKYKPPPNVAKIADPRAGDFISKHGKQSWEVDALRPEVLNALLRLSIESNIDVDKYKAVRDTEQADIEKLEELKSQLPEENNES